MLDPDFMTLHTSGWPALRPVLARYSPEHAASITGLSTEIIVAAARRFGRAGPAMTLWSMGINQSHQGTDKNTAILNLHLPTGQIGRPGAGPVLSHGTAQRHGRPRDRRALALAPRLPTRERPRGARGGRAALGNSRRDG